MARRARSAAAKSNGAQAPVEQRRRVTRASRGAHKLSTTAPVGSRGRSARVSVLPANENARERERGVPEEVGQVARPYFTFENELRDVPTEPTHCKRCSAELEPLRRYAGLCRECIVGKAPPAVAPTAPLKSKFTVLRELYRTRPGFKEKYVEVQCECGQRRVLKWATWAHRRPACCGKCRLKSIEAKGFEAEYAR